MFWSDFQVTSIDGRVLTRGPLPAEALHWLQECATAYNLDEIELALSRAVRSVDWGD